MLFAIVALKVVCYVAWHDVYIELEMVVIARARTVYIYMYCTVLGTGTRLYRKIFCNPGASGFV